VRDAVLDGSLLGDHGNGINLHKKIGVANAETKIPAITGGFGR
jgi:hypothetical protein